MPDYGATLKPQKRLGGLPGLKKNAVLPTIIIKEQDRQPLRDWQDQRRVQIHIWHAFFDQAFGLSLDDAEQLLKEGKIEPTVQVFQSPNGATSSKIIYKFYYHYAYPLGQSTAAPTLVAQSITDKNGHILPYVTFHGGTILLDPTAVTLLDDLSSS